MYRRPALSALLIFVLIFIIRGTDATEQRPMFLGGAGASKCRAWIDERKKPASVLEFGMEGWLTGFVSGISEGSAPSANSVEQTFLFDTDNDDFLKRVDKFCHDNPETYLIQAALVVSADLMAMQATRIKNALEHQKNGFRTLPADSP